MLLGTLMQPGPLWGPLAGPLAKEENHVPGKTSGNMISRGVWRAYLGLLGSRFGASWNLFEASWGPPGGLLEASWGLLGPSGGLLGPSRGGKLNV